MQLTENIVKNLKSFEQMIDSISDGSYNEEFTAMLLQVKCRNLCMEADIAMALYPERTRPTSPPLLGKKKERTR